MTKDSLFFLDSNLWVYLLGKEDERKSLRVLDLTCSKNIVTTVQVVNETISALKKRKFGFDEGKIREVIDFFYDSYEIENISKESILQASFLREKYGFQLWDSLLVSSALNLGCNFFYSEDLHEGLLVEGRMKVVNPFS